MSDDNINFKLNKFEQKRKSYGETFLNRKGEERGTKQDNGLAKQG